MKKLKTLLAITILTLSSIVSYAQSKTGKISGSINDGSQKTLESATVSLLKAKDSSVVKMGLADKAGKYEFEQIAPGNYLISVSVVGYEKAYSPVFDLKEGQTSSVPAIQLTAQAKSMAGVTVTSKRPMIEQKIDRTVVNVEASVTNVGSSALEVLEKSPGITIDKDGNISLKGKQGVQVFIDGRPSYLSGTDLANYLRSLNANQLDQIEIMTNPPAKYDAAGNSGIINIKTKKNKQMGYNGNLTLGYGQGKYPKFNESFNFNYRQNKVNLFGTLSHNYRKNFENLDIQRTFYDPQTKEVRSYFDQHAKMKNNGSSYSAKIGMDYFATKNTTLGFVLSGFSNPGSMRNDNITNIYDDNMDLIRQTKSNTSIDESWKNYSTNLNFRHVLDTSGSEITADFDHIRYKSKRDQSLTSADYDRHGIPMVLPDTLLADLPQSIKITSGRVDYLKPLKKGAKFEAGFKTSFVETDSDAAYDSLQNGTLVQDKARSNHFIYEENINAAYVNYSKQFTKKLGAQLGLRLENTISKGFTEGFEFDGNQFVADDTSFRRSYTQLFPTAFFQYAINDKNNIGLNYGRRIQRPNYQNLNPFIMFLDRYTYMQGNPNLKPQFAHNIELSHTYKGFLTTTFNYTRTNDIIQQVLEQDTEKNETYVQNRNIARQRQYGVSVSAMTKFAKWWNGNIYVNVYNNKFVGITNDGKPLTAGGTTLVLSGSQQFTLSKTWSAEASGFFRTTGFEGVFAIQPMGALHVGLVKQVMKGKGSVRLNIRDIFYTQKPRGVIRYNDVDAAFQNQRDTRVANLSFTYRFSKGKMNGGPKRRASSASEEQNRVGAPSN